MKIEIYELLEPLIKFVGDKGLYLHYNHIFNPELYFDIRSVQVTDLHKTAGLLSYGVIAYEDKEIRTFSLYMGNSMKYYVADNAKASTCSVDEIVNQYPLFRIKNRKLYL